MRILLLGTDVYGGHGGIALYNRDLVAALASIPACDEVVVVPRIVPRAVRDAVPRKVTFVEDAAGGTVNYLRAVAGMAMRSFDLVVCGHLHLLPVARTLARDPVLLVYGIEAWRPPRFGRAALVRSCRRVVAISEITRDRLAQWSGYKGSTAILPNAVHAEHFGIRPKRPELLARYGLEGKRVLLTVGRAVAAERYKGFDEVIEALPHLPADVVYLVAGGGDDLPRLCGKAERCGVAGRVVFTGEFAESEKADLFALADAYVMPSRGEGFGFVFLEALATGLPVLGSRLDGGREALRGGELGLLVDPTNPAEVVAGVEELLARPGRRIPEGLEYFSFERFRERVKGIFAG